MTATPGTTSRGRTGASRLGACTPLIWALWFGLVSGLVELAAFLLKCHYLDPRNANVSRHYPWMFPVAGVLVLAGPGVVLAIAARLWPTRVTASLVVGLLSFVAYLGFSFRWPIYTAVCLLLSAGLALRTARFVAPRRDRFDSLVGRSLVVLTVLLAVLVTACYGRELLAERKAIASRSPGAGPARNVILLVLDTVRAQSLSLYGYPRDTTPNLKRLAARGVRFDHAYASAPWTAPSHASMFTGRWCHELSVGWDRPLDRKDATLAEYLAARGYATAGFVANTTYCSYETGLDRGFAHYEDYDVSLRAIFLCSSLVQRGLNFAHKHPRVAHWVGEDRPADGHRKSAERINGDFLAWLQRHRDRPFFAFLNYFDAHHPYLSPGPEEDDRFGRKPESPADVRLLRDWWDVDKRRLDRRDVELARDSYDRCIAYLDRQIGDLFAELERSGLLSTTLVIVTADHGEHLGEHALFGHGSSLYLPELHVPLLLIAPGSVPEGRVVDEPVSLRDLAATVIDRIGVAEDAQAPFPGRSLARTWSSAAGSAPLSSEPLLSEIEAAPELDPNQGRSPSCRGPLLSLLDRNFHYIRNGDGREELYDHVRDPGETVDIARSPESADALERFRTSDRGGTRPRPGDRGRVGGSGAGSADK